MRMRNPCKYKDPDSNACKITFDWCMGEEACSKYEENPTEENEK